MKFLVATLVYLATFFVLAIGINQEEEFRTWKSASGKFTVEAKLTVQPNDQLRGEVVLVKTNGKTIRVAYDRLDAESQQVVLEARRAARQKARSEKAKRAKKENINDSENSSDNSSDATESATWNWRGPNRDGVSSATGLLQRWPESGPALEWTRNGLGGGMSSVAIGSNKIFTLGQRDGGEHLIALNLADGKELWATAFGAYSDSNATPTVDDDLVFGLGLKGDLICCNVETGEKVWSKNFAKDFGGKMMSEWGYSESPLIDGDKLICTPGGPNAMIVALDKKTGRTIWSTPMQPGGNRGQDGAGYSSPVISEAGGIRQYITLVGRGLISVAADDGKPLWQYEKIANGTANVPTPIVDGDYVFCSSGYDDGGTALLRISGRRGSASVQEVYYRTANQLQNHHGGMIKIGDYVYMGEGHNNGLPVCVEFRTGRPAWPKQRGAGSGSAAIVAADGHLYFRYENGIMALIEANPNEYKLKGSFRIASRNGKSWPHPVVFGGKLYLRDQGELHCYDISQ